MIGTDGAAFQIDDHEVVDGEPALVAPGNGDDRGIGV